MNNTIVTTVRSILKERSTELLGCANVVATGVGYKMVNGKLTDTPSIICSVANKVAASSLSASDLIPAEMSDCYWKNKLNRPFEQNIPPLKTVDVTVIVKTSLLFDPVRLNKNDAGKNVDIDFTSFLTSLIIFRKSHHECRYFYHERKELCSLVRSDE